MTALAHGTRYDVAVIGGGPAGATAATDLAREGRRVVLVDGSDRIKPCGGALPPLVLSEFGVPESLLTARVGGARITAPSSRQVDMRISDGFVGMVDRATFDPWLRARAAQAGVTVVPARLRGMVRDADGSSRLKLTTADGGSTTLHCRFVIGADGASSTVRRATFGPDARPPYVFAYHEIIASPTATTQTFDPARCEVHYAGDVSPDFYGWIFPHGPVTSVGVGSARKGFDYRQATATLRARCGLDGADTIRREGAPLPLRPMRRWDDGRGVLLVGDAAGCVAPASGEGIYYAMQSGRFAAEAVHAFLETRNPRALAVPRRRFMQRHGLTFALLGMMQDFWYASDARRERFAAICGSPDVQRLTWESYLRKRVLWRDPLAHLRVLWTDTVHIARLMVSRQSS